MVIAKGCAFLHNTSPPVMHRDLKSPNILLADLTPEAAVVAKLCDFGVSLSADTTAGRKVDCPGTAHTHTHTHTTRLMVMRTVWLAPEILEKKPYSEKADVYSLGVIFWELLTKEQFFGEVKFMALLEDMVPYLIIYLLIYLFIALLFIYLFNALHLF
jgi:serine/threonine protein kinase